MEIHVLQWLLWSDLQKLWNSCTESLKIIVLQCLLWSNHHKPLTVCTKFNKFTDLRWFWRSDLQKVTNGCAQFLKIVILQCILELWNTKPRDICNFLNSRLPAGGGQVKYPPPRREKKGPFYDETMKGPWSIFFGAKRWSDNGRAMVGRWSGDGRAMVGRGSDKVSRQKWAPMPRAF